MSQTATKTNDSLTVIPTKHLALMVKELEEGDKCAKKLRLVQDNYDLCYNKTIQQDSLIAIGVVKEELYKQNISSYKEIILTKDKQIRSLKQAKRAITIGGVAVLILSFLF